MKGTFVYRHAGPKGPEEPIFPKAVSPLRMNTTVLP